MDLAATYGRGVAFPVGLSPASRLALSEGPDNIAASLRLILSTEPGERVMLPAFGTVPLHGLDILIHTVMRPQPFALRRMAREHLDLAIDLPADVDLRRRHRQLSSIRVAALDRIAIV